MCGGGGGCGGGPPTNHSKQQQQSPASPPALPPPRRPPRLGPSAPDGQGRRGTPSKNPTLDTTKNPTAATNEIPPTYLDFPSSCPRIHCYYLLEQAGGGCCKEGMEIRAWIVKEYRPIVTCTTLCRLLLVRDYSLCPGPAPCLWWWLIFLHPLPLLM